MTLCRLIAPLWLTDLAPNTRKVLEGQFSNADITKYNTTGYNVYYLPNHPSQYQKGTTVDGAQIDVWNYVFVDFDLKSKTYPDKDAFIERLTNDDCPPFSKLVDSGGGIHAYWRMSDLDAKSYLRLSRRLMRLLNTDEAVGQIFQLMRLPNTINTKDPNQPKPCEELYNDDSVVYTAEELDRLLPPISQSDESYCNQHYDKTFNLQRLEISDDSLPAKFGELLALNHEAKAIFSAPTNDRSKDDYRLGHIMLGHGFTKEEALRVLVNSAKAMSRAPVHRIGYAQSIIEKIWTYEQPDDTSLLGMDNSALDIRRKTEGKLLKDRFPCYKYIDNTVVGFRKGHVMGLVAGSGVGKTAMALNIFMGFTASNPEQDHFFFTLEQPAAEIAERWETICNGNEALHSKVQIIGNYSDDGVFRDLSLETIKKHVLKYKEKTGKKVGCVVIDHIGVLCNNNKLGIDEGVKQISKAMKGFAVETDTFLIMQSQTSREKSGVGDLELNKDAAFGTSVFENFCDYLVTLWQPLKRCHDEEACPTVMAFKFCKIRHKKAKRDKIKEDRPYYMYFDPDTETMKEMTQDQKTSFNYFLPKATNRRKEDRKTQILTYHSTPDAEGDTSGTTIDSDRHTTRH